jgi:hypothetical protein
MWEVKERSRCMDEVVAEIVPNTFSAEVAGIGEANHVGIGKRVESQAADEFFRGEKRNPSAPNRGAACTTTHSTASRMAVRFVPAPPDA